MENRSRVQALAFMVVVGLLFTFLLSGCEQHRDVPPAEMALTLTDRYEMLEETYKSHYIGAGASEREFMSNEIAPLLDKARQNLILYNELVSEGLEPTEKRLEIIRLLRFATVKLAEVE